jgi:hypothetical protein
MSRITITISDPWDLVTVCGSGPFLGTAVDSHDERLVVRLDEPLRYQGHVLTWAVCYDRLEGDSVKKRGPSRETPANLAFLSAPPSAAMDLRDATGVGAIGSVRGA